MRKTENLDNSNGEMCYSLGITVIVLSDSESQNKKNVAVQNKNIKQCCRFLPGHENYWYNYIKSIF